MQLLNIKLSDIYLWLRLCIRE